jgi:hypothetical protein
LSYHLVLKILKCFEGSRWIHVGFWRMLTHRIWKRTEDWGYTASYLWLGWKIQGYIERDPGESTSPGQTDQVIHRLNIFIIRIHKKRKYNHGDFWQGCTKLTKFGWSTVPGQKDSTLIFNFYPPDAQKETSIET